MNLIYPHWLVLKVPKDLPPFIGVRFKDEFEGERENPELFEDHRHKSYRIVIEPLKGYINLKLICDELVTVRFYNRLNYDPEKLRSWLYITRNAKLINFGHVHLVKDYDKIIKDKKNRKSMYVKCEGYELQATE